jgi:hypothetical protein
MFSLHFFIYIYIFNFLKSESEMHLLRMIRRNGVGSRYDYAIFAQKEEELFSCVLCLVIG